MPPTWEETLASLLRLHADSAAFKQMHSQACRIASCWADAALGIHSEGCDTAVAFNKIGRQSRGEFHWLGCYFADAVRGYRFKNAQDALATIRQLLAGIDKPGPTLRKAERCLHCESPIIHPRRRFCSPACAEADRWAAQAERERRAQIEHDNKMQSEYYHKAAPPPKNRPANLQPGFVVTAAERPDNESPMGRIMRRADRQARKNRRAITNLPASDAPTCNECGAPLPAPRRASAGRRRLYCNDACKSAARRRRRHDGPGAEPAQARLCHRCGKRLPQLPPGAGANTHNACNACLDEMRRRREDERRARRRRRRKRPYVKIIRA